jgi:hypothetical protein
MPIGKNDWDVETKNASGPFTFQINCSSDLKKNLDHWNNYFLTLGKNNL